MIHAYLLRTPAPIEPWQRPARELMIHNCSLLGWQYTALGAAGIGSIETIDSLSEMKKFPCFLLRDNLYLTPAAMRTFAKLARKWVGDGMAGRRKATGERLHGCRAALQVSPVTERFVCNLQGAQEQVGDTLCRGYDCYYLSGHEPQRDLADQTTALRIPYWRTKIGCRAHRRFEPSGHFTVPVTNTYMLPITHWATLVAANLMGMTSALLNRVARHKLAALLLPWLSLLRSGSLRPGRLLGKSYFAGPRCRVHPTAHVEGAILGKRVKIGPHAVVRYAVIGDCVDIGPSAVIEGCSVGDLATINGGVQLRGSIIGSEASVGCFFNQLSVIGDRAVLCPDSGMLDYSMRRSVQVQQAGQYVATGSRLLGSCIGDDAFLGPGVIVACGFQVPSGCTLLADPRNVVRELNDLPDGIKRMDSGRRGSEAA